jgi:hypothetical protein
MASDTVVQYVLKVDSKGAQKALDGTAKEADELSKSLDKLGDESKDASKGMKGTEQQSKKTSKGMKGLKVSGAAAASAIAGIGAAAVGTVATVGALAAAYVAAGKAAFDFTRNVVDSVNDLNDLSAQSALSAQSIQAVRLAFEGSGQSAESASAFISRFPRLMADLEAGTGRASEAAAKLGLEIRDTSGQIKSSDQILRETIGSLQQIENDTERTTTAFLLLGRNAGQLLQAFAKTSNFENFLALSEEFGVKTGPEASAAAGQFQELLAALNVVLDGTKQALVEAVGGVGFFNEFLLKTLKLVAGVQVLLEQNKESINEFSNALVEIGGGVVDVFTSMLSGLENYIAEAVTFMVMKLTTPLYILNLIGAISDETFAKIENVGLATQKAGRALEDIAIGVQRTEEGAVSAGERVEELVKGILAGISIESKGARPPIENLSEAIEKTGDAAKKQNDEYNELVKETERASRAIESATSQFFPFEAAIKKAEQQVYDLEDAFNLAARQGIDTAEISRLLAAAEEDLTKKREASAKAAEKEAQADKKKQREDALSKFETIASLDPASIISLKNPLLGAFTGIVQGIGEQVIEKGPAQIRAEALAQAEAIKVGIGFLPELFLSIAPQLGIAIAEAFLDGFLLIFVNLKDLIIDAFNTAFSFRDRSPDGNDRTRRRRRRRQAMLDFINPMESATFMSGGRFIPKAQGGIRFTGMQEGLAMLHRGEFVVPQSGQRPQQVDRQLNTTTGGGMTININSAVVDRNAVDALVREIEIRFNNQFGTSSSNLFGGR